MCLHCRSTHFQKAIGISKSTGKASRSRISMYGLHFFNRLTHDLPLLSLLYAFLWQYSLCRGVWSLVDCSATQSGCTLEADMQEDVVPIRADFALWRHWLWAGYD